MKKSEINKLTKTVEKLDWSVYLSTSGGSFEFQKFSPAGQEFNVSISATNLKELVEKLYDRYDDFDCSEEAYIWLDNTGHGTNGAPYDMKDLYEDMEACQEMIKELAEAVQENCVSR